MARNGHNICEYHGNEKNYCDFSYGVIASS
jgi:hypothetical protein